MCESLQVRLCRKRIKALTSYYLQDFWSTIEFPPLSLPYMQLVEALGDR